MSSLEDLRIRYDEVCREWVVLLCSLWDLDVSRGSWIDEVGGTWDYCGIVILGMSDLIYCVEHSVSYAEYKSWRDWCFESGKVMDFRVWLSGYRGKV